MPDDLPLGLPEREFSHRTDRSYLKSLYIRQEDPPAVRFFINAQIACAQYVALKFDCFAFRRERALTFRKKH